jgi:malonyl-CoA O-methyltransferase
MWRSRQSPKPLSPQDAYALWASNYPPRPHNRLMEIEQSVVESLLADVTGRDALDAGCGTGRYMDVLQSRGARVCGVDLSPAMLSHVAAGRRLVRGRIEALPFSSGSFDVVVSGLVLGDTRHLAPAIAELARVLKPGGQLIYSVVHPFGADKGWSRTFEANGRQRSVAGFWHSVLQQREACAAAGLTIAAWREPRFDGTTDPVALIVEATR